MSKYLRVFTRAGLVFATVGGTSAYYTISHKYEDFKSKFTPLLLYKDNLMNKWSSFSLGLKDKSTTTIADRKVKDSLTANADISEDFKKKYDYDIDSLDEQQLRERLEQVLIEIIDLQKKHKVDLSRLEHEIEELRKELFISSQLSATPKRAKRKSLVEMYGEVLDILSEFDSTIGAKESLPRIVVVGDQSSGKTSVLEFIAKARIFPRGSGEMMTRAPVMVTMGEGHKHIASFRNDPREFNLSNEKDVSLLRKEIEQRMLKSVKSGKTISNEIISLNLKGPGIPRMVLVDLPGIINTVTSDMSLDAKDSIVELAKSYMSNPNSIILCVQDGSVDAERSLVTDLVSSIDPNGSRTICVLTKMDVAEKNNIKLERIQKLLSGRLFPMKALNYFAVVAGTGNPESTIAEIANYEEEYFKNSSLFLGGNIKPSQATSQNLIHSVSQCFWEMVRSSVEREAENLKSRQFALEAEWKHNFPNMRELDRDELFEKARADILDDTICFSNTPPNEWENLLSKALWNKVVPFIFRHIYLRNALTNSKIAFQTQVAIDLQQWEQHSTTNQSIEIGKNVMLERLGGCFSRYHPQYDGNTYNELFKIIRSRLFEECKIGFEWSDHNYKNLSIIQKTALGDNSVSDRTEWDQACSLMESVISEDETRLNNELQSLLGPSFTQRWLGWKSPTPEQIVNQKIGQEFEKLINHRELKSPQLTQPETSTVIQNLSNQGISITQDNLRSIWEIYFLLNFYQSATNGIHECRKSFRHQDFSNHPLGCQDVVLFFKVHKYLQQTVNTMRQQIDSQEARRMENFVKNTLDDYSVNNEVKYDLFQGRQVDLATEIKKLVEVKARLDAFIQALQREKNL